MQLEPGLQQALTDPRVLRLAGLLKVDLSSEAQRNALLTLATSQLKTLATADTAAKTMAPVLDGGVVMAAPHLRMTLKQVQGALRSYREIAAL